MPLIKPNPFNQGGAILLVALALLIPSSDSSAAIAFRSATSATVTSGDPTATKPTGTVQGDFLMAAVCVRPETTSIAPPTGWVLIQRLDNANTTGNSLAVYGKLA